ncbi:MAG: Protease HtpX [Chlamydiia bacterium]|nr:Protease HtpX [Chlamydiia bacterium]
MIRRLFLFLGLNILIVACVSAILDIFQVKPYITNSGLNFEALAIFCFVWGMVGAIISLLLSKKIAKWMLRLKMIKESDQLAPMEQKLFDMIQNISTKAGLSIMPEVAIFKSRQCNAFATGSSKNSSLIAVSTELLDTLSEKELEAVIAHEMTHITNGDMVTMCLLQGVINAFVMFLARALSYALVFANRDNKRSSGSPFAYFMLTMLFEMIFLSLGSILIFYVSRKREFAADNGAAYLTSKEQMISALQTLDASSQITKKEYEKQKSFAAMMIRPAKPKSLSRLFATHPSIEERIQNLKQLEPHSWAFSN